MHIAIALKKQVVAWFGPTCAHEIELYGRGEKIVSDFSCSPCWNRNCNKQVKCNDALDLSQIIQSIQNFSLQDKPHLVDL
jgi:heptosyltransferase II